MATPELDDSAVVIVSPTNPKEAILRVSAGTSAGSLASALSHALYEGKSVTLRAVGAGAVNQAMKACAIARGYVASRGYDLLVRPGFRDVQGKEGVKVSAMVFIVIVQ